MCTNYVQSFKILASFCSWAGWFESYPVENPPRHVFAWCGSIVQIFTVNQSARRTLKLNGSSLFMLRVGVLGVGVSARSSQRNIWYSLGPPRSTFTGRNFSCRNLEKKWNLKTDRFTWPPIPLLHSKNQYCVMKTRDLSAMKERDLKFGKTIKFSFSMANCRNGTMLYCHLFIHLLPPAIILSGNAASFQNMCWSGKSAFFSASKHFYFLDTCIFVKKRQLLQCSMFFTTAMSISYYSIVWFLNLFSNMRNRMFCATGICYEGEGLSTVCLDVRIDGLVWF